MPRIHILVELGRHVLFRLHALDAIFLHLAAALQDVLHLSLVARERAPLPPIASCAVDDEVIRKACETLALQRFTTSVDFACLVLPPTHRHWAPPDPA